MVKRSEESMNKLKIGIIGMGFVGSRLYEKFKTKCDIVSFDKTKNKDYPYEQLVACDFVMICVDTPQSEDGSVCIDNVEEAIGCVPNKQILLRSTVPPGTTDYLLNKYNKCICFAPEYVGESIFLTSNWNAFENKSPYFILGGTTENIRYFRDKIEEILGPNAIIMQMNSSEAELVKYMENSYFALKVSFVNEFRMLADHLKLDWNSVREGWLLDSRVERDHTSAFKAAPGYSGKCLPKDVNGIIKFAEMHNFEMSIMKAVQNFNSKVQHKR